MVHSHNYRLSGHLLNIFLKRIWTDNSSQWSVSAQMSVLIACAFSGTHMGALDQNDSVGVEPYGEMKCSDGSLAHCSMGSHVTPLKARFILLTLNFRGFSSILWCVLHCEAPLLCLGLVMQCCYRVLNVGTRLLESNWGRVGKSLCIWCWATVRNHPLHFTEILHYYKKREAHSPLCVCNCMCETQIHSLIDFVNKKC